MSDVLSELVTLAASPALVDVLDEPPHPTFALDDQAIALRAIEAGIDEARTSGTRAAVCVADLTAVDDGTASRGPVGSMRPTRGCCATCGRPIGCIGSMAPASSSPRASAIRTTPNGSPTVCARCPPPARRHWPWVWRFTRRTATMP